MFHNRLTLFFIVLVLTFATCSQLFQNKFLDSDERYEQLTIELQSLMETGVIPPNFLSTAEELGLIKPFHENSLLSKDLKGTAFCTICAIAATATILQVKIGLIPNKQIANGLVQACTLFGIYSERVCQGVIDQHIDYFIYIIEHKSEISYKDVCGILGQNYECSTDIEHTEWHINIAPGNSVFRIELDSPSEEGAFNVLQLSDIHLDPNYKPHGNAKCNEPICCQSDQPEAVTNHDKCGYWTDYRAADCPSHLIKETIRHIKTTHKIDWIYFTGDVISHRAWDTTPENNANIIIELYNDFRYNFDVPIFPILGNHEPSPLNVFTPKEITEPKFDQKWLYELVADLWTPWVGEEARATILKGGYYTVSPRKGLRIIGLNGNVCYIFNWWLIYNSTDPFGQLQFLADTLKIAENKKESVHILNHMPSGDSQCHKIWSREYHRIIERFAHTITGHFNGHTHFDEFHLYYNSSEKFRAINVAFNGGAIGPYSPTNPSYRLYSVDKTAYTLLDSTEWTFNLTAANLEPNKSPKWYQLYSFREAYGIENLQSINVVLIPDKMLNNQTLLDLYFKYKHRNSDAFNEGCDNECKKHELCSIVTAQALEYSYCNYYRDMYTYLQYFHG